MDHKEENQEDIGRETKDKDLVMKSLKKEGIIEIIRLRREGEHSRSKSLHKEIGVVNIRDS